MLIQMQRAFGLSFLRKVLLGEIKMANIKHQLEWPAIIQAGRRNGLSDEQIVFLLAMREAENGPAGYEFGSKEVRGTNLDKQAGSAAASIKKNEKRYQQYITTGQYNRAVLTPKQEPMDFSEFMGYYGGPYGNGWAPVIDKNGKDTPLNKNWANNVRFYVDEVNKAFSQKGIGK